MDGQNRGSHHGCPVCRHQRRRCDGNCEFGQYFGGNRGDEFENACRLFGLSNLLRIMRSVEPHQRQAAADSILEEGNAWANDPVHGCLGVELNLMAQIDSSSRQLDAVNRLLAFFRQQQGTPPVLDQTQLHATQIQFHPSGSMGGMLNLVEPFKPDMISFPSSHEKGESSTRAPNADEKGKMIVDEEGDIKACEDKGKDIGYPEDTDEAED